MGSRHDIPPRPLSEFEADSDDTALKLFNIFKKNRQYDWDDLVLERFERPPKPVILAMSSADEREKARREGGE